MANDELMHRIPKEMYDDMRFLASIDRLNSNTDFRQVRQKLEDIRTAIMMQAAIEKNQAVLGWQQGATQALMDFELICKKAGEWVKGIRTIERKALEKEKFLKKPIA